MVRWIARLALGALVLGLCACGTGNVGVAVPEPKGLDGFKLTVLDDSLMLGATVGSFELASEQQGRDLLVSVRANAAQGLRAIYFDLDYDPELYRPLTASVTDALGPRQDMLEINVMRFRGTVHYGAIVTQPQLRTGMTGSGTVVNVVFRRERMPETHESSAAPGDAASKPLLSWPDIDSGPLIEWRYFNTGDYNQDGQVLATDLGPIGLNFGLDAPDPNSALGCIDGNGDHKILGTDLGPIGLFFQTKVARYDIYSCATADEGSAYPDGGTLEKSVAFSDTDLSDSDGRDGDPAQIRLMFSALITDGRSYWVRPADVASGGSSGVASNAVHHEPDIPLPATLALLSGSTGGLGSLLSRYVVSDTADLTFQVLDGDGVTVRTASALFDVQPLSIGTVDAGGVLNIADGQSGQFSVSASLDSAATNPATLYFEIETVLPPEQATLELVSGSSGGSGSEADPFTCTDSSTLRFRVLDLDGTTEIQGSPNTHFSVNPPSVGTIIVTPTKIVNLSVGNGTTGDFNVSCVCQPSGGELNTPTDPPALYFRVGSPPASLFILQDPADSDWDGVLGTGTSLDPYVVSSETFNTAQLLQFTLLANTAADGSGTAIDPATLTWNQGVPFTVAWVNDPADGIFTVSPFTNSFVSATSAAPLDSNQIFLVTQGVGGT